MNPPVHLSTHFLLRNGLYWLVIVAIGVFYVSTLVGGHNWGGDFSQYIHHAKNLAEGKAYNDILYISNSFASVSPAIYPPVFPLILAPVYAIWGLNLMAMKLVGIVFLVSALAVLSKLFQHRLSSLSLIILALIVGLNPYFWIFKDNILSDLPYLFFSLCSLYFMQRNHSEKNLGISILLGIFMYLAYGTREIGITLPLALLTYELWHYHKLRSGSLIALALFVLLAGVQWVSMQFEPTHPQPVLQQLDSPKPKVGVNPVSLDQEKASGTKTPGVIEERDGPKSGPHLTATPSKVAIQKIVSPNPKVSAKPSTVEQEKASRIKTPAMIEESAGLTSFDHIATEPSQINAQISRYFAGFYSFWETSSFSLGKPFFWLINVLAIAGFIAALFERVRTTEIYFAGHLFTLILFLGNDVSRYLLPLFPFYVFYILKGVSQLKTISNLFEKAVLLVLVLVIAYAYFTFYSQQNYSAHERGIASRPAQEVFEYLRNHTQPDDVLVERKPRVFSLITQRNASDYPRFREAEKHMQYYLAIDAKYLITRPKVKFNRRNGQEIMESMLEEYPGKFSLVFSNRVFNVYMLSP